MGDGSMNGICQGGKMITKVARLVHFDGLVQGVGFRYAANTLAKRYAITGYVQNVPGGLVELYAEGPQEDVDEFIDAVREEMGEYITNVDVQEAPISGEYTRFMVKY
jgi:acylphosphatase